MNENENPDPELEEFRTENWPEGILPINYCGCNSAIAVDCIGVKNEIYHVDAGLVRASGFTLQEWFEYWLRGEDLPIPETLFWDTDIQPLYE